MNFSNDLVKFLMLVVFVPLAMFVTGFFAGRRAGTNVIDFAPPSCALTITDTQVNVVKGDTVFTYRKTPEFFTKDK